MKVCESTCISKIIYNIFIICQKNNKINKITYKKEHVQKNKKNKKLSKKSPEHILGSWTYLGKINIK